MSRGESPVELSRKTFRKKSPQPSDLLLVKIQIRLFYVIADLHLNIKYNKLQEREYFMDKNDTVSVSKDLCKSVFKSGKSTPSVSDFTQKWIELINNREKKKTFSL